MNTAVSADSLITLACARQVTNFRVSNLDELNPEDWEKLAKSSPIEPMDFNLVYVDFLLARISLASSMWNNCNAKKPPRKTGLGNQVSSVVSMISDL